MSTTSCLKTPLFDHPQYRSMPCQFTKFDKGKKLHLLVDSWFLFHWCYSSLLTFHIYWKENHVTLLPRNIDSIIMFTVEGIFLFCWPLKASKCFEGRGLVRIVQWHTSITFYKVWQVWGLPVCGTLRIVCYLGLRKSFLICIVSFISTFLFCIFPYNLVIFSWIKQSKKLLNEILSSLKLLKSKSTGVNITKFMNQMFKISLWFCFNVSSRLLLFSDKKYWLEYL